MSWALCSVPFFFQFVPQFKDLDFDLAFAIVFENALVRLSLSVAQAVEVFGVGRSAVARLDVGEVALDVARGAGAARRGEADVVRHVDELCWERS